ncbi:MAG: peptide chain release factor 2 [Candidatus Dasytiphilus stammeri]
MLDINYIRERIQDLIKRTNLLQVYLNYANYQKRLQEINNQLETPNIWQNINLVQSLSKERLKVCNFIQKIDNLLLEIDDLPLLLDLGIEYEENQTINEVITKLNQKEKILLELEIQARFTEKNDKANCYIDIKAGSGGIEAQDWANMLLRMYSRWAYNKGFKIELLEESQGEIAGIKSATLHVSGDYAFGWLRTETGIHRLVRKSPFNSGGRRHTSFSSIFIYPEVDNTIDVHIKPNELRIDVYRASGAGGQHVNRTESAVRITHVPTGIITQCQNGRSQHKNKDQALKQLKAKLYDFELKKRNTEKQIIEENKLDIGWGRQIRSYILDNSRIKDLRTGVETRNIHAVLNGELDIFIKACLKAGL